MVLVNEAGSDKPVVLAFGFDQVRSHHQPAQKFLFVEGVKAYNHSNGDENDSSAHGYGIKMSAMIMNLRIGVVQ